MEGRGREREEGKKRERGRGERKREGGREGERRQVQEQAQYQYYSEVCVQEIYMYLGMADVKQVFLMRCFHDIIQHCR